MMKRLHFVRWAKKVVSGIIIIIIVSTIIVIINTLLLFSCIVNFALAFLGPCGGMFCFGAESLALRKSVIQKYNVIDDDAYCCGSEKLGSIHLMCSYPCALFQVAVSLEEWNHEKKLNEAKVAGIIQPTVDKGINI